MTARRAGRLRGWLSVRHSLRSKAVAVLTVYGLYELARGLVVSDAEKPIGTHSGSSRSNGRCTSSSKRMSSAQPTLSPVSTGYLASPT
jgi:hypothetical protein